METTKVQKSCRICSGRLRNIFNLGRLHQSGFVKPDEEWPKKVPLVLVKCDDCKLVQLRHTAPLDSMYRQYWYRSGLNKSMVGDLEDVVRSIEQRIALVDKDIVVDIGCNDGTLFDFYATKDLWKVGFDPALNLSQEALKHCDEFFNDYFSGDMYLEGHTLSTAKVVTAIAMFYDLSDPNWFIKEVKKILHPAGIFVVQFTDLLSMMKLTAFDNICHEHLEYYSLKVLAYLMDKHDLEIFDVEYNTVNGGSIRIYVQWNTGNYKVSPKVSEALKAEHSYMENNSLQTFAIASETVRIKVTDWINKQRLQNKQVFVLGASTKGNTFLQYCDLTNKELPYAAEINQDKYGLISVGSGIPIIPEAEAIAKEPYAFLVLPWHFKVTFLKNLRHYMEKGGKLLFPLPEPRLYFLEDKELRWISL